MNGGEAQVRTQWVGRGKGRGKAWAWNRKRGKVWER